MPRADSALAAAALPAARLYGQPMEQLPLDLYIPPDALEIILESFEGPLDLLLYLIRRQNFNVLDIPMAQLTRQYLAYVDEIRARNLALAAEYLVMAATLIDIKSRLLLPAPPVAGEEEPADPRAELVRRLLEYERIKAAAEGLDALPRAGRDFWVARVPPATPDDAPALFEVTARELAAAWAALATRGQRLRPHAVARARYSVQTAMADVLRALRTTPVLPLARLIADDVDVPLLVVTLIATLELAREGRVTLAQDAAWGPIVLGRGRLFAEAA